jgi:hypothetical protein
VGVNVIDSNLGSGPANTPNTQIGVRILSQSQSNTNYGIDIKGFTAAATTTNTGILIEPFTGASVLNVGVDVNAMTGAGTKNVGLRIAQPSGATTNLAMQFSTQSTTESGGILFGSGADSPFHANMYRSGNGRTRTDGEMQALHFLSVSGTPTAVAGTGAGTGPTVTVTGTDAAINVVLTVGTAPTANAILFTITFVTAYSSATTVVVFSAASLTAAALSGTSSPYLSANTASTFTFHSGSLALTALATYQWNFSIRS